MPPKGYRKGLSDRGTPVDRQIYTRLPDPVYAEFKAEARSRCMTTSGLTRAVLVAYRKRHPVSLPHAHGARNEALRELARIGNNLNQLTRQANVGLVPVSAAELRAALSMLLATASRL